ncbi:MAG: FG-GAP-like repeat-containing protein [Terracidiphilus sp.]
MSTTTTLAVSSKTVNGHPITVMTAAVNDPSAVTQGLVNFYDGKKLIGSAQLVGTGKKYTVGTANLAAQLAPGSHSLKAVFAGTSFDATSASAVKTVTVTGSEDSVVVGATGSSGNYTLTAQLLTGSATAATGSVSFVDQTLSNFPLGTAPLGSTSSTRKFSNAAAYSIYDPADYATPVDVAVADFNGDGILDLAVLDYDTGLSIYLGNGDGTFAQAAPFCTIAGTKPKPCNIGSEPNSLAVGDFNSDGIPDLVVASQGRVDVALGNGDGTFQQPVKYDEKGDSNEVHVADMNGDGTPDLVVSYSGGVSVMLGNGDGTFQPHNETSTKDSADYISIGDFNKDGIPDVAAAGWNGDHLAILMGNGDGTFKAEVDTKIDVNTAHCMVRAADLKGSGYKADVTFCGDSYLEAAIGKGDGTFNAPQEIAANGDNSENVAGLAIADINGDGADDVVMTWYGADTDVGRIEVFTNKNDGTGTLNTGTSYYVGQQPVAVAVGDFNGDGTLDLAVANEHDSTMSVLLDGYLQSAVLRNVAAPGKGTQWVAAQYAGDSNYGKSTSAPIALTGNGVTPPTIFTLAPSQVTAGAAGGPLVVTGAGFASGAKVLWNGTALTTTVKSATELDTSYTAAMVASQGTATVTVSSGGVTSNGVTFTITAAPTKPTITSLSPSTAVAGSGAFTLTVNGTGFATGAVVKWNGNARTTAFVSAVKVTASILSTDVANAGTFPVTVVVGGVASSAMNFTVTSGTNPPTLTSVTPNYVLVGSPSLTITVVGTNFVGGTSGSYVEWGTSKLATTYVSPTQMTATVPAADLTTLGTYLITVMNPGAMSSASLPFTVAPATHTPLAYGFFNQNGTPGATSGNIACAWVTSEYQCTIAGENFYYSKYVVNVTVGTTETPAFVGVNSIGGQYMLIKFLNPSGAAIQAPFYVVVYKP